MFYIISGDCVVNIKDDKNVVKMGHRLLVEGDHFGEIGLIYGCQRTASIQSRNYNTMATLGKTQFWDLMGELPDMLIELKRHVYRYSDPMKTYNS